MSLSDRAAEEPQYARHQPPKDYRPGNSVNGDYGSATTEATKEEVRDERALLLLAHLDPEVWKIADPNKINARMWQNYHQEWLHYYKFDVVKIDASYDLPALIEAGRRAARAKTPEPAREGFLGAVAVWADPQTGKTDSRGGFEELAARVTAKQDALDKWLARVKPTDCLFADVGDGVEGFENTAGQGFTNGLSLMEQIEAEATFEFDTIARMARRAPTKVFKTTSNHAAWRRGKDYLGKPSDDWGLHIGKMNERTFAETKLDVSFFYPQPWDHSMAADFGGTIIGLHHGHMVNRPEGIPDWWARQTHGAGAVADADILLTGHFHHFRAMPTGRNRLNGKVKWWLQAPTLDNGSAWYRNRLGDDSDPGLMVFTVNENGFDLGSLEVL